MSRANQFGLYDGQKVEVVRPGAPGDPGYDPERDDQVLIEYVTEGEEAQRQFLVSRSSVQPLK